MKIKSLLLVSILTSIVGCSDEQTSADFTMPNPKLTPGDTMPVTLEELCTVGYTKKVRNVPDRIRKQVFQSYGLAHNRDQWCDRPQGCELDHLISLELGGSNDIKNLWPEPYQGVDLNAHTKDRLENKLHKMVCKGEISLEQAQQEIATDWVKAFHKYIEK